MPRHGLSLCLTVTGTRRSRGVMVALGVCPLAAAGVRVDRQGRQLGDLAVGLGMAKALSKMLPARRETRCAMMLFSCEGLKEKPLWSDFEVHEEDFVFSFN